MLQLIPGQQIHFIGIAGVGLSAIARVLLDQGFTITGSDMRTSDMTDTLANDGAIIYHGHSAAYVGEAEFVIRSSAIPSDHIEVLTALAQKIPVYKREDVMETVMRGHYNIAVAGTHGKTTTTSMIVHLLQQADKDPSFIVGGTMGNTGKNAGVGNSDTFVIEADEYDNMFHGLRPNVEVITNIEHDHPDFFKTPQATTASYSRFIGLLPADGVLIGCADDPITSIFLNNRIIVDLPTVTYGIANLQANWLAQNIRDSEGKTIFTVTRDGEPLGDVSLSVPGHYNVLNALAALIVADHQGIAFEDAAKSLTDFKNSGRRFDIRGEREDVIIVDDYAHHPTEIKATIHAARQRYPQRQVWAVWQPHTFTRVKQFMSGFAAAFDEAHNVLVTPIYASREKPLSGISSENVIAQMTHHPSVQHAPSLADAVYMLREQVQSPAIILVLSAGDATSISDDYLTVIESAE
jgi:UDP-N-acetylmuramate--alanine ligase